MGHPPLLERGSTDRFAAMSASKRWMVLCLTGIALWIAAGVIPGVLADDPTDPAPTLIGFAAGGTVFFGLVFGYSLWRTRAKPDPELDALLRELSLEEWGEWGARLTAASIGSSRRLVQTYLVLGIIVTGLGLSVMWQEGLDVGNTRITIYAMVGIVVVWAAAVPAILGWARRNSQAALAPLGLTQNGAELVGERNGRAVVVALDAYGSRTRVEGESSDLPLTGDAILAYAARGSAGTWTDVEATQKDKRIEVKRRSHENAHWLWDLWLAERLAGG